MAKKKVTVEVSDKFSDELVQVLTQFPHVEKVWINEEGEAWFTEKAGLACFTRQEILGEQTTEETTDSIKENGAE